MDTQAPADRWRQSHSWNVLLVIAMTLAIAFAGLGWQMHVVRHRRAMRAQLVARAAAVSAEAWTPSSLVELVRPADRDASLSAFRSMLGDEPVRLIGFGRELTAADRETIEAFPEADVVRVPMP